MIKMDPWHPFVIDLSEKRRQRVLPSHRHHHHHHLLFARKLCVLPKCTDVNRMKGMSPPGTMALGCRINTAIVEHVKEKVATLCNKCLLHKCDELGH